MVLFQVAGVPSRKGGYPLLIFPVPQILVRLRRTNFSVPWTTGKADFAGQLNFFTASPQTGERAGVRGKDKKGNSYTINLREKCPLF